MKRYKIAAWLMIIYGGFMEIGGVLCALPALILGSGKFDIGQYFSFKLQYFQDNLYMILFMGAIFGVMRIIGAIGLLKNRMWGLALSVINCVDILVREYRCSGGTDTANPAPGNRCSRTEIPHLIVCYLRVYSLKAGSNPYTSRIDL